MGFLLIFYFYPQQTFARSCEEFMNEVFEQKRLPYYGFISNRIQKFERKPASSDDFPEFSLDASNGLSFSGKKEGSKNWTFSQFSTEEQTRTVFSFEVLDGNCHLDEITLYESAQEKNQNWKKKAVLTADECWESFAGVVSDPRYSTEWQEDLLKESKVKKKVLQRLLQEFLML